jgi:hypothetical protein
VLDCSIVGIPNGIYYIGWDIDYYGQVSEQDEGDNLGVNSYGTLAIAVPGAYPDLCDNGSASYWFSPTVISYVNQPFGVGFDLRNAGAATAGPFRVSFYASANTSITPSDYFLGELIATGLYPGDVVACDLSKGFPALPNGVYYLGWIIDAYGSVVESNEYNNWGYIGPVTVNVEAVRVSVSPGNAKVRIGKSKQFHAATVDARGSAVSAQPAFSWSVSGGGTISQTGNFRARKVGAFTVTATADNGMVGSTRVKVRKKTWYERLLPFL